MRLSIPSGFVIAATSLGCLGIAGCDSSNRLATYPVTIVVAFPDGKPLGGGHLTLQSADHSLSATGTIDAEGVCHVGTYVPSDGAVSGVHRVAVIPPRPPGHPDSVVHVDLIDRRFLDPNASGLKIEVKPDDKNEFHLQVKRPSR